MKTLVTKIAEVHIMQRGNGSEGRYLIGTLTSQAEGDTTVYAVNWRDNGGSELGEEWSTIYEGKVIEMVEGDILEYEGGDNWHKPTWILTDDAPQWLKAARG